MNNAYGYSGWFNYAGTFNGADDGLRHFFGELDCCLPWAIDREYMVVDDCSNVNTFAYTVSVNGGGCNGDVDAGVSGNGDGDHTPGICPVRATSPRASLPSASPTCSRTRPTTGANSASKSRATCGSW